MTIGTAVSVQFRVDQMPAQTVEQSGVYRSYYILSNPIDQMESYIADALRSAIPGYTLDEVFDNKDLIAQNVKDSVTELMAGWPATTSSPRSSPTSSCRRTSSAP